MAALSLPAFLGGSYLVISTLGLLKVYVFPLLLPIFLIVFVGVVVTAVLLARLGPRRGWHTRGMLRLGWTLMALSVVAFILIAVPAYQTVRRSSRDKAIIGNLSQLSAAEDQYVLENGNRIFINYDELVGSNRYIHRLNEVEGEDYRAIFPHGALQPFVVTGPDNLRVSYDPYSDATTPMTDGVHISRLKDGRRFEITWHGGVPDGPFRAYRADGTLWGEATYVKGRLAGPSWLHLPDGRKFDELTEDETKAR
jgi:hypothetical protein